MKIFTSLILFIGLSLLSVNKLYAHKPENALIYLKVYEQENVEGSFHVNVHDINNALDLNLGKHISLKEVEPHIDRIKYYLKQNSSFTYQNKVYEIVFNNDNEILWVGFGDFISLGFYLKDSKNVPDSLNITYKVFIEENPKHVNLLAMEYNWKAGLIHNESIIALDFDKDNLTKTLSLKDGSLWTGFVAMIKQGTHHIWIGLDHILFILALILPAVVRRKEITASTSTVKTSSLWNWHPVDKFKPAFIYIVKIITFFTIAHTITLSLASLQILTLPSRLVESLIALSIGLAAYHNIKPIFKGKDWVIAFVFGLFHGFGFATVLGELGFKGENLSLSLLGFNIGVEIGQLVIIIAIFPILYLIRKLKLYPKFLVYLSAILIIISLYWLIERAFDIDLPLDEDVKRILFPVVKWLGLR
ncbi:HupE/UreJ family protein [Hyunsoonleella pacifica]|uniref:HupE/UreJ family protein n=1 Tax=Hyunsoonleella pacifica TaxID=1080224 RepID=A0A4Q9FT21_9FLAO|nr:HupE/UreJ family protein [Hyunsoonleella pacifica]TBN18850.1 HupE/UreJ family protein [Hyunsoonleella pacifica]GGD05326.1 membrane protein [Hyunsoonleella pacifica]